MLHAHPDKFSLDHEKIELATEVTTQLIELYKNGELKELQDFHLHIMSGNALIGRKFKLQCLLQSLCKKTII